MNIGKTDWTSLESVKEAAKKLGKGQVVYKNPARNNYNITHATRTDVYKREWVLFET